MENSNASLIIDIGNNFNSYGFVGPIDFISNEEASYALEEVQHYLKAENSSRFKLHLVLPTINKIAHHPILIGTVQQALQSENLLLWSSDVNIKDASSPHYFCPHQDNAYAGLSPTSKCLTAWIALSHPVGIEEGCLLFYPKSHMMGKIHHSTEKGEETKDNLLSLGQFIHKDIVNSLQDPTSILLQGGQATLHSFDTVHSSGPNLSNKPRVGLALRYITYDVIQTKPNREMATWISGYYPATTDDNTFNFDIEPTLPNNPTEDDVERGRIAQREALRREESNYFSGSTTDKKSY